MKKPWEFEPDVSVLLKKIQEQLTALDRKVDSLINRGPFPSNSAAPRPAPKPSFSQPHQGSGRPYDPHKGRPMFQATCADCQKSCEIPFRPSGDRPVYCKECFSRRRTNNTLQGAAGHKPQEKAPVSEATHAADSMTEPMLKEKKRQGAPKKMVGKKKPVAKKKKK